MRIYTGIPPKGTPCFSNQPASLLGPRDDEGSCSSAAQFVSVGGLPQGSLREVLPPVESWVILLSRKPDSAGWGGGSGHCQGERSLSKDGENVAPSVFSIGTSEDQHTTKPTPRISGRLLSSPLSRNGGSEAVFIILPSQILSPALPPFPNMAPPHTLRSHLLLLRAHLPRDPSYAAPVPLNSSSQLCPSTPHVQESLGDFSLDLHPDLNGVLRHLQPQA